MSNLRALLFLLCMAACACIAVANAQSIVQAPLTVSAIQPVALSSGQLAVGLTMSNGQMVSGTSVGAVNTAQVASAEYDTPASGATIQVAQGTTIEVLQGASLLAAVTVDAPQNPVNNQLFRIGATSGLTVTLLTIKSYGGAATIGTGATVLLGFAQVYIYQGSSSSWVRIQ